MRPHSHDLIPRVLQPSAPELSIVVPVRDERDGLAALVTRLTAVLDALPETWELLFVDDGSRDGSVPEMEPPESDGRPHRRSCSCLATSGVSRPSRLEWTTLGGRPVIVMDADLQEHHPELLSVMVAHWRDGVDVVYGVRSARLAESRFKRWTAAAFYRLLASLSPIDIPVDSG